MAGRDHGAQLQVMPDHLLERRFVGEMWALVFGVSVTVVTAYSLGNQWGGAFLVIFLIAFYASAIRPTKTGRR